MSIGTKDAFVRRHFLRVTVKGVSNDDAEDEFGRIENLVLPTIRHIRAGTTIGPDQDQSVKAAMSMLWARSFALEVSRERIHREVVVEFRSNASADDELRRRFVRDRGRQPEPGDLEALVEQAAARMAKDRVHDVAAMVMAHNWAIERFRDLHVVAYQASPRQQFITSDNPVMISRDGSTLLEVGAQNRVAMGDANFIFMPLSPIVAVCLTQRAESGDELLPEQMYRLNNAMWRNAVARIACHPSFDWSKACAL